MDQTSNNCDHPTDSSQNLMAAIFLGVHLAGLIPHLCVFPATFQLAKKLSAFMLLLTINVMHFFLLIEPDFITSLILTIGIVFLTITTLVPSILYCICVIFMVVDGVKKAIFTSTANSPPPAANNAIDHLMRERTRLYLICLLSTLPPFILLLLPITQQMLGIQLDFSIFFTPFYAIFHLQQPILMMALSVKLQHEMLKDFKNTLKLILRMPSTTNGGTSFVGIRHAWT
ncbi:hypothetical protein niasHS_005199 [Heterodera schachtii]|uniref:G protein-coupled receptor n=1 Tax=Heterodera schachtii TaxID=97005 RepID=A0ABD2JY12_HETSC